jgi:hypothetical protein
MRFLKNKKLWPAPLIVLVPVAFVALRPKPQPNLSTLPPVIVWAWERPEKLDFINTDQIGVAFLAKTITFDGDMVYIKPRLQPLELSPGTKLIAVARIETHHKGTPAIGGKQFQDIVKAIADMSRLSNVSVVQLDFDAFVSERKFYRALLTAVRQSISSSTALSITALASWCAGDNWLADLPIDEAVPMLFRMGIDARQFQSGVQQPTERICRNSAGVSTDEPITRPNVDRLYIFSPNPWSRDSLNRALETYKK